MSREWIDEPNGEWQQHVPAGVWVQLVNDAVERDRYRSALKALLEEAVDMRSYVPDYFAKKWNHDEALDAARKALR